MQSFPLLDIADAIRDIGTILEDVTREVGMLLTDSNNGYPPAAVEFTANVQALRELLGAVMPEAFQQAVDAEATLYDEESARWEPSTY